MNTNRSTRSLVFVFALACAVPVLAESGEPPAQTNTTDAIVIEVSGLETDDGQIGCAIFKREDGFPDEIEKAQKQILIKPKGKKAKCTFDGWKPGVYGVSVMHDLDMNGELNTSFVGKPQEPWGVSRNTPARRFGPPRYEDCKFRYEGGHKMLEIKLQR